MLKGADLIADINACSLADGQCCLWWLGQQSFAAKLGRSVFFLDLFLTPHPERRVEPLLQAPDVKNADFFLGSHDHLDHIDRAVWPALAQASPSARFIVPELLRPRLARELDIAAERFIGLDDNQSYGDKEARITGIAAAHELLDRDSATGHYPYLGYVVEANGCRLYHAGDTCNYEGLQSKLQRFAPDIMLLPINGRDAQRLASGCIGNLTYQEAADLAGAVGPRLTIPAHYDMFAGNSENPALFVSYMQVKYPRLEVKLCKYAERMIVTCIEGSG